ncbi:MAG: Na+/H+ antiporter subunit E [Deltaproteobacteria bacterium]|nr:Na+/H+ antiporter subunit E [Deltaproteobacteria bacterium]
MKIFFRTFALLRFIVFYLKELVLANLTVAYDAITPRHHMHPGVVAVPLDIQSDLEMILLTNLISMTPGTLCLDVSSDRKTLFVHVMYLDDKEKFIQSVKNRLERYILEIVR